MRVHALLRMWTGIVLSVLLTATHASETWPTLTCENQSYWMMFANMEICLDKSQVEHLNYLNLSSPSLHITFNAESSFMPELGLNRLDAKKTTGGMHSHLGLSVYEMFSQIISTELMTEENTEMISTVLSIDDSTNMLHYKKQGLDAFVILRKPSLWDEIYILGEGREGSIQLSGQFDIPKVEWLLARLRW